MRTVSPYLRFVSVGLIVLAAMSFSMVKPANEWQEITVTQYEEMIKKTAAFFDEKSNYSMDVSISSYKTHQAVTPYETQVGYVVHAGRNYHHYMMGIHSFQNKNYAFVVDSTEKNIMIAEPGNAETMKMATSNYNQYRSYITKISRLSMKDAEKVRIEFSEKIKVASMEMEFEKNWLVRRSVTYFRVKLRQDPNDKNSVATSPRIETVFRNYKGNIRPDYKKEFDESNYFQFVNGKFIPVKAFADYTIKDTRLKTK